MAKKQRFFGGKPKQAEKIDHNFFGTKKNMVVKEIIEDNRVVKIIAKDEKGLYEKFYQMMDVPVL